MDLLMQKYLHADCDYSVLVSEALLCFVFKRIIWKAVKLIDLGKVKLLDN